MLLFKRNYERNIYQWRAKYDGLKLNEAKKLKGLNDKNRQQKNLIAELSQDIQVLSNVIKKT
jgi:putative transposase